jgi:hypothetical protein
MLSVAISGMYKNKRPQQSPEPSADRESPVHALYFMTIKNVLQTIFVKTDQKIRYSVTKALRLGYSP